MRHEGKNWGMLSYSKLGQLSAKFSMHAYVLVCYISFVKYDLYMFKNILPLLLCTELKNLTLGRNKLFIDLF